MHTLRLLLTLVFGLVATTDCALGETRSVSLANDTSRSIVLVVNGDEQAVVLPHQSITVPASGLDAGDWFVEARLGRTPGSTKLGVWMLARGSTRDLGPAGLSIVDHGVVGLSCGSLTIWTGTRPVETPGHGAPGDCTD